VPRSEVVEHRDLRLALFGLPRRSRDQHRL
jgi:hypothetical protein